MGETWRRTLGVTAISQVFSIVGFSFVVPFLPLYIQQLGVHGIGPVTLWAAFLSGGSAVAMAFTAPIWGALADRHGRKIMVVRAALSASLIIAMMGLVQNVFQLLLLRMLQGAFTGTVSASQALVASQTPRDRLGFSLGVMQTAVFAGNSLGPLLGGVVADEVGFRPSFFVAGGLLFIAGMIVAALVHEERVDIPRGAPRPRLIAGMKTALMLPGIPAMVTAIFGVQFASTIVFPILPQFVQVLQGPSGHAAEATGLILAAAGLAGALASTVVGAVSDRLGYRTVLVVAGFGAALFTMPQFLVHATWQLLVLRVLSGLAMGAVMPSASALVASLVQPEQRGTAYGLTGSATSIGMAIGPLTAAAIVSVTTLRAVFLSSALVLALIGIWVASAVNPFRDDAEPPIPAPPPVRADADAGAAETPRLQTPGSVPRRR